MTDTETKFDPNWPHGWDIVLSDNRLEDVQLFTIHAPGVWPVIVMDSSGGIWKFSADGVDHARSYYCRLVNRPAPKASGTGWIVVVGSPNTPATFYYSGEGSEQRAREYAASLLQRGHKPFAIKRIDWTEGEGL